MDPLGALGLASNILQCVQLAGNIISKSREIYKSVDGATEEVVCIADIARNLSAICQDLPDLSPEAKRTKLSTAEKRLRELCEETKSISAEFLKMLEQLEPKEPRTGWNSFKQALNSTWKQSDIRALEKRLDGIRKQLNTTLLICLRYS